MNCKCGCGKKTNDNHEYIWGHNRKGTKNTKEHNMKNSIAQKGRTYEQIYGKRLAKIKKNHIRKFQSLKLGSQHNHWKGGKPKSGKYNLIYCPSHPNCINNRYVYEHRLVMERHIGRHLLPTEIVHHINNDGHDNRIENLIKFDNQRDHLKYYRENK